MPDTELLVADVQLVAQFRIGRARRHDLVPAPILGSKQPVTDGEDVRFFGSGAHHSTRCFTIVSPGLAQHQRSLDDEESSVVVVVHHEPLRAGELDHVHDRTLARFECVFYGVNP